YHEEHGDKQGRYHALVFEEGQPVQIEGAALVKGAFEKSSESLPNRQLAEQFLDFLLSSEVQDKVALKNWMYPVTRDAKLPESFRRLPKATKVVRTPTDAKAIDLALARWKKAL